MKVEAKKEDQKNDIGDILEEEEEYDYEDDEI